ncbi:hypothetical protein DNTS_004557 [Danionella cerebrum]|uniref:Uncharacterized protein n=1 Tax=Danionella cerebrum TaxID=2873325 RepID=A0A553PJ27_9TELE|nr:hypothetical protein DNTS_004557 [Danionella translucida]
MAFLVRCYANCLQPWSSKQLPGDLSKMHLTDPAHQQSALASSQSGCSIASDSGSSSLSDIYQATESDAGDVDLSGLPEAPVDSEEEEDEEEIEHSREALLEPDRVRESLEIEPHQRSEEDIELCGVMRFLTVEREGTVLLQDKQQLDQWYVILYGAVEISSDDGRSEILCMGNSFGIISPSPEPQFMTGGVCTRADDCQFVCVSQEDYCRILNQVERNTHRVEEEGEIVMVKEHRELDRSGTRKGHVVIKGTPERLVMHLVEEPSVVDPTYIEDFLLMQRTFLKSPMELGNKLLEWFREERLRDTVTRIVLLWVNNHFSDFEGDPQMTQFLQDFEKLLDSSQMKGHLRLLNIACAAKAKPRQVVLQKSSKESPWGFSVQGGSERGFGIFLESVEEQSKATEAGLKCGDQIMEINGQNFEDISLSKALDILKNNTHLSLTVKTNIFVFKELERRVRQEVRNGGPHIPKIQERKGQRLSIPDLPGDLEFPSSSKNHRKLKANTVSGGRNKIRKMLEKTRFSILPPKPFSDGGVCQSQDDSIVGTKQSRHSVAIMPLPNSFLSSSSPDLLHPEIINPGDAPDQVVRVFRSDQQSVYIVLGRDWTAADVVRQALNEFGLIGGVDTHSLCEVCVSADGLIKQRRLPERLSNLADRIPLNARYYLKNNLSAEALCSDEEAQDLLREARLDLLELSSVEVAAQLSLRDFSIFRSVEAAEYVQQLFRLHHTSAGGALESFENLLNLETFWVASEVLREPHTLRRMKIIKHFIKIALHCRQCKNFNSMFAIVSGLNLAPVARLRATWEKLPSKYEKLLRDLQDVFDPSRNMIKYRNILSSQSVQPPIIPLLPVLKKDLTFLHEGNDSSVDGLVNFEKLRMIAKEIRHVVRMTSANMDPALMFRQRKRRWKSLGSLSQGSASSSMLDPPGGGQRKRGVCVCGGQRKRCVCARRGSLLNGRKLYEEAQMARRVKQYLNQLKVEEDEEKMHIMSLQCEAAYTTPVSKNLSERLSARSEASPVSLRSSSSSSRSQSRVSQVLQVPPVTLNPLRKRSFIREAGSGSPQTLKKASEESCLKRSEDLCAHPSPAVSPQGSPRKASQHSGVPLTLSGVTGGRSVAIDLSDSSEISSRSSIVSVGSVDSFPSTSTQSEVASRLPSHHSHILPSSSPRVSVRNEPKKPEQTCAPEPIDSGRGSWTSCSSHSHDNLQKIPTQRGTERHTPMGGPIAELEAGPTTELDVAVQETGPVLELHAGAADRDAAYKTIRSSTEKGLIVYCVTSPSKDARFTSAPPTPVGYQGLTLNQTQYQAQTLGPVLDGGWYQGLVKPPEYSVALQRCKLGNGLAQAERVSLYGLAECEEEEQVSAV